MEQSKEPRNKPTHMWSINLQLRSQEYTMGERIVSSINGVGRTGQPHPKN